MRSEMPSTSDVSFVMRLVIWFGLLLTVVWWGFGSCQIVVTVLKLPHNSLKLPVSAC